MTLFGRCSIRCSQNLNQFDFTYRRIHGLSTEKQDWVLKKQKYKQINTIPYDRGWIKYL